MDLNDKLGIIQKRLCTMNICSIEKSTEANFNTWACLLKGKREDGS